MSLEQLVCAIEPVRNIPVPALNPSDTFDPADETKQPPPQLSIPKELWRLVDTLWQGEGMREKDLLASSSEPGEVRTTLVLPGGCSLTVPSGCAHQGVSGHRSGHPSVQSTLRRGGAGVLHFLPPAAPASPGAVPNSCK